MAAIRSLLALLLLMAPTWALAQDAGDDAGGFFDDGGLFVVIDASVPDASVGEGGADRDQQEGEDTVGRIPTVCRDSDDCSAGFSCQNTRCVYTGIRRATGAGCLGAAPAMVLLGVVALVARRRRE